MKNIKLTEQNLHRIVKESVNKVLNESNSYNAQADISIAHKKFCQNITKLIEKYSIDGETANVIGKELHNLLLFIIKEFDNSMCR